MNENPRYISTKFLTTHLFPLPQWPHPRDWSSDTCYLSGQCVWVEVLLLSLSPLSAKEVKCFQACRKTRRWQTSAHVSVHPAPICSRITAALVLKLPMTLQKTCTIMFLVQPNVVLNWFCWHHYAPSALVCHGVVLHVCRNIVLCARSIQFEGRGKKFLFRNNDPQIVEEDSSVHRHLPEMYRSGGNLRECTALPWAQTFAALAAALLKLQMRRRRRWLQAGTWLHALSPTQSSHINQVPACARLCTAQNTKWLKFLSVSCSSSQSVVYWWPPLWKLFAINGMWRFVDRGALWLFCLPWDEKWCLLKCGEDEGAGRLEWPFHLLSLMSGRTPRGAEFRHAQILR